MKHKVSELTGALLDAAVAKAAGWRFQIAPARLATTSVAAQEAFCLAAVPDLEHGDGNSLIGWHPSASWEHGGPIIEREEITVHNVDGGQWLAATNAYIATEDFGGGEAHIEGSSLHEGPTPLIAAMRAYVASKLGEEIDLPLDTV